MNSVSRLYADLGGLSMTGKRGVLWPTPEEESRAAQAVRAALGRMLRSARKQDMIAARAVYAEYFGIGEEWPKIALARGLRRLRADPEVRRLMRASRADPTTGFIRPTAGAGWITVREAARLSRYSEDHIRKWLVGKGKIRSRTVKGRIYVNRSEIRSYARKMTVRGYGPRED